MTTLNNQIAAHSFSRVYLFFGNEQYLAKQYLAKLLNAVRPDENSMGFTHYASDICDVNSIISDTITMPFFEEFKVTLVEDSSFFKKKTSDSLKDALSQIGEQNILIFSEREVDKRLALFKAVQKEGTVLEFETPDEATIKKWLTGLLSQDGIRLQTGVPAAVIRIAGTDMSNLTNEAAKLRSFAIQKGELTVNDVMQLCSGETEDKVFEMCDAIGRGNKSLAISRYNDLVELRTPAMKTLSLITRHYTILMQLAEIKKATPNMPYGDMAKLAGIPAFTVKQYLSQLGNRSVGDLVHCTDMCQQAELYIKRGAYTDTNSLERLIINLMMTDKG